jgi:hypothetical protein
MLNGMSGIHHNRNRVSEDLIPSEEPLINVREFWGNELNHNYRMRWPRHLLEES